MNEAEHARVKEIADILDRLVEVAGPAARPLIRRLEELHGEQVTEAESRALRICGAMLLEHDLTNLWEQIYAASQQGCLVRRGDAHRFLFRGEEAA
jgi:hypothetical protein